MWERLLLLSALLIASSLGVAGAYGFVGKQFRDHSADAQTAAVQTQTDEQLTSEVAAAERTPIRRTQRQTQRPARAAATAAPPDRTDCAAMRGTKLRTRAERQWVIDNCLFLSRGKAQAAANRAAPTTSTRARPTTPAPRGQSTPIAAATPPSPQLTRSAAIANAVEWLALSAPMDYGVGPESCTAIWLNDHWVVTCQVSLTGCSGAQCAASVSLCVFGSRPMIVADSRC